MANEVRSASINANSITDTHINGNADIKCSKMRHAFKHSTGFGKAIDAAPGSTVEEFAFVADGPGQLMGFHAALADTGSSTDIKFDLKKNGSSVLASTLDFTQSDADGDVKDGSFSSVALVAGDVVTILMTVTSSTGALGPRAWINWQETNAPE